MEINMHILQWFQNLVSKKPKYDFFDKKFMSRRVFIATDSREQLFPVHDNSNTSSEQNISTLMSLIARVSENNEKALIFSTKEIDANFIQSQTGPTNVDIIKGKDILLNGFDFAKTQQNDSLILIVDMHHLDITQMSYIVDTMGTVISSHVFDKSHTVIDQVTNPDKGVSYKPLFDFVVFDNVLSESSFNNNLRQHGEIVTLSLKRILQIIHSSRTVGISVLFFEDNEFSTFQKIEQPPRMLTNILANIGANFTSSDVDFVTKDGNTHLRVPVGKSTNPQLTHSTTEPDNAS